MVSGLSHVEGEPILYYIVALEPERRYNRKWNFFNAFLLTSFFHKTISVKTT